MHWLHYALNSNPGILMGMLPLRTLTMDVPSIDMTSILTLWSDATLTDLKKKMLQETERV